MTPRLTRRIVRRFRDSSGSNLIEAAIITPLLLVLTLAIVDFASVFYVYLALENGVSQASRFAVTGNAIEDPDEPGSDLSREDSIKAAMRDAAPTLTFEDGDFTFTHLPPGASTWVTGTGGANDIGKVTVSYTWTLMTPVVGAFFPDGQVTLVVDSAMKNERRFE